MSQRWNKVFAAGIVWDPREPLPAELQDGHHGDRSTPGASYSSPQDTGAEYYLQRQVDPAGWKKISLPGRGTQSFQAIRPEVALSLSPSIPPPREELRTVRGPRAPHAPHPLPSLTVQRQGRNVLPPLSVVVNASIVQDTARISVTQNFWNDSSVPIKQAAFAFPLPTGCTVTSFSCTIGTNKTITGIVKPKEEAREAFDHHIRHNNTAAGLLEQDNPEIFTTTLGNIPDQTTVRVELCYISVLKHRFTDNKNVTTLILPTSIAPRYGQAPEGFANAVSASIGEGLTLEVDVIESDKITSITSPSHPISADRKWGADNAGEKRNRLVETSCVRLEPGSQLLDKDFVLDIVTAPNGDTETPQAWLEEHPTFPNHKALMLTLPPSFLAKSSPPMQRSEIIFLADRSGSMSDKIASLKSAIQFFLKGIPVGRRFNIWCFGTKHTYWQPTSVDYTDKNLQAALAWVQGNFAANMGGTELLPAIKAVVAARDKALMTDVIVLTDGQTWYLDQTLDFIQKTRSLTEGRVRFFALGIGHAVSHALVDGIAKAGGGYAEVVQDASQGGWEDRVVSMTKAALLSAHLGPLRLEFDIRDEDGATRSSTLADAKRSPADISAIAPFDRNRIYFLFDSVPPSASITSLKVEATANYGSKSIGIPVRILPKRDTMLHKLAARSMLDDLERGCSHIHLGPSRPVQGSWEETNTVRKEAEQIACKWSLVSKWTSFFLAEEPCSPVHPEANLALECSAIEVSAGYRTTHSDLTPLGPVTGSVHQANVVAGVGYPTDALYGRNAHGWVQTPVSHSSFPGTGCSEPRRGAVAATPTFSGFEELGHGAPRGFDFSSPSPAPAPPAGATHPFFAAMNGAGKFRGRARGAPMAAPEGLYNSPNAPMSLPAAPSSQALRPPSRGYRTRGATSPETEQTTQWQKLVERVPTVLGLQKEMVDEQKPLQDNKAGRVVERELLEERRRLERELLEERRRLERELLQERKHLERERDERLERQCCERLDRKRYERELRHESLARGREQERSDTAQFFAGQKHLLQEVQRSATTRGSLILKGGPSMPPSLRDPDLPAGDGGPGKVGISCEPAEPPARRHRPLASSRPTGIPREASGHGEGLSVYEACTPTTEWDVYVGDDLDASFLPQDYDPPTVLDGGGRGQQQAEREFIGKLLRYQVFDGHINFGSWATAEQLLGKEISDVLRTIENTIVIATATKLWTAAVLVLLDRDFQSCKALWELMALKMESCFPELRSLELNLRAIVRMNLEGLELPVKRAQAGRIKATAAVAAFGSDVDFVMAEGDKTEGAVSKRDETPAGREIASAKSPKQEGGPQRSGV